jgi:hypothetical protein
LNCTFVSVAALSGVIATRISQRKRMTRD